ncbi:MAG: DUF4145 domain-containing protein [Chlorobiales bacterium]|nr:DUF4145 domain-containing protein [Chlorobiales bacterium]
MKIELNSTGLIDGGTNISLRCPHCGHHGVFILVLNRDLVVLNKQNSRSYYLGIRKCPNDKCNGHLFFIKEENGEIIYTSPSETIPFDKESIPANVLNAFDEAIKCHSNNCFTASAIMIRKTLEEICHDRGAIGNNLKNRIKDLGSKIVLPKELLEGLDDLRLLGNDAAHIEATTFTEIGKEEIEISIDFTKEILKAVYQYEKLLNKLRNLKDKKNSA